MRSLASVELEFAADTVAEPAATREHGLRRSETGATSESCSETPDRFISPDCPHRQIKSVRCNLTCVSQERASLRPTLPRRTTELRSYSRRCNSRARATALLRVFASSFRYMDCICVLMVFGETNVSAAIAFTVK